MIYLFIVAVIIIGITIYFAARWLYDTWRLASTIALLSPAIIESEPFYKLVDMLLGRSHAMERHSPITTIKQQIRRANTGITPEGFSGYPVHSGRWQSHYPMLQAIEAARALWQKEVRKKRVCYVFQFDKAVGSVTQKKTKEQFETKIALVVIAKNGDVVTAFPSLDTGATPEDLIVKLLYKNPSPIAK